MVKLDLLWPIVQLASWASNNRSPQPSGKDSPYGCGSVPKMAAGAAFIIDSGGWKMRCTGAGNSVGLLWHTGTDPFLHHWIGLVHLCVTGGLGLSGHSQHGLLFFCCSKDNVVQAVDILPSWCRMMVPNTLWIINLFQYPLLIWLRSFTCSKNELHLLHSRSTWHQTVSGRSPDICLSFEPVQLFAFPLNAGHSSEG